MSSAEIEHRMYVSHLAGLWIDGIDLHIQIPAANCKESARDNGDEKSLFHPVVPMPLGQVCSLNRFTNQASGFGLHEGNSQGAGWDPRRRIPEKISRMLQECWEIGRGT
jgi:hypothetical protein